MNTKESITNAYNLAAKEYADLWWNEFDKKHFDRIILDWYAQQIPKDGTVLEIGCGPGEVSGYLSKHKIRTIGTDLSNEMIENARRYFPSLEFEVQDFCKLKYADNMFFGVIGYYAIVNLTLDEIQVAFNEIYRILKSGCIFLFTFHTYEQDDKTDVKNFFNKDGADITFYYHKVDEMKILVEKVGFEIIDIVIRYPYKEVEYQSKRSYFILRKN